MKKLLCMSLLAVSMSVCAMDGKLKSAQELMQDCFKDCRGEYYAPRVIGNLGAGNNVIQYVAKHTDAERCLCACVAYYYRPRPDVVENGTK